MEYNIKKEINVNDIVECITSDGIEVGLVKEVTEDKIKVYMYYTNKEEYFTPDLIIT